MEKPPPRGSGQERDEGLEYGPVQNRRPRLDRQGLIGRVAANRYRARIAAALGSVGAMGRFQLRKDQRSSLRPIKGDVLPEEFIDKCVISYPLDCEIVFDIDKMAGEEKLEALVRLLQQKGYPTLGILSSVMSRDTAKRFPDRNRRRWQLRVVMPDTDAHRAWTDYISEQLKGYAQRRSALWAEDGSKVVNSQATRLPGFLPATFRVPAWGAAVGKRRDNTMDDASIKQDTDLLYRVPGFLDEVAGYAEEARRIQDEWEAAPPAPAPLPVLKLVAKKPAEDRSRMLTRDIDPDTMRLLDEEPQLGDRSDHAFKIVRRLKSGGWTESAIAELIYKFDGLVAYRHKGGTEDGNAEHGRARLRCTYSKIEIRESDEKRTKDAVWALAQQVTTTPSKLGVLEAMLFVKGMISHLGDREIQRRTGLSPRAVTKAKKFWLELGVLIATGPERGPGDIEAQSYSFRVPSYPSGGGVDERCIPPVNADVSRWDLHQQLLALRGRGVATAFRWNGESVIGLVMQGMTAEDICKRLGVEGVTGAWRQRSATLRRLKRERERYEAWLRRSMCDGGDEFMVWQQQMQVEFEKLGVGRWRAAA